MGGETILRSIGIILSVALLSSQLETTAQPNPASEKSDLRFHRLKVEPLVASTFPTHRLFHDGLKEQVVVITAQGLERIGWDPRPEGTCWLLRLPEKIFVNGRKLHYQVGLNWEQKGGRWSYADAPIRDLLDAWEFKPGRGHFPKPERQREQPIIGRQAASIEAQPRGAYYRLSLTNTSEASWRDVYVHLCLNHYQAPMTGYRPFLKIGDRWIDYPEVAENLASRFLPVKGMGATYSRLGGDRRNAASKEWMPGSELGFPGIVCWNVTSKGHLLISHFATQAIAVMANQNWPCTDLHLWFGEIRPGQTVSRTGRVLIAEADLEAFIRSEEDLVP